MSDPSSDLSPDGPTREVEHSHQPGHHPRHESAPGDPPSVDFRAERDFPAKLSAFTSDACAEGSVVVLLGEGGQDLRRIYVDGDHDFLAQVDATIEALTRSREVLARLKTLD